MSDCAHSWSTVIRVVSHDAYRSRWYSWPNSTERSFWNRHGEWTDRCILALCRASLVGNERCIRRRSNIECFEARRVLEMASSVVQCDGNYDGCRSEWRIRIPRFAIETVVVEWVFPIDNRWTRSRIDYRVRRFSDGSTKRRRKDIDRVFPDRSDYLRKSVRVAVWRHLQANHRWYYDLELPWEPACVNTTIASESDGTDRE